LEIVRQKFDEAVSALRDHVLGFRSGTLGSLDVIIREAQSDMLQALRIVIPAAMGGCSAGSPTVVVEGLRRIARTARSTYFRLMAAWVLVWEFEGDNRVEAVFHAATSKDNGLGGRFAYRAKVLNALLESVNATSVLEVGVNDAITSEILLETNPQLQWFGVDCWAQCQFCADFGGEFRSSYSSEGPRLEALEETARARLLRFGDRATIVKGTSAEAARNPNLPGRFDVVFIDGCHTLEATEEDLRLWAPRALVVAGHDYNLQFLGVPQAVHRLLPRGVTLELASDSMYWWRQGIRTPETL